MNQFIIQEDYIKCSIYLIMNIILSIIFFLLTAITLTNQSYFITLISITILWFTIKYMIQYGKIMFKKIPICSLNSNGIKINYDQQFFEYKDIIHIKIIPKKFKIQLLIKSLKVEHPTQYYYVNISYLFKYKELKNIENQMIKLLKDKKVKII